MSLLNYEQFVAQAVASRYQNGDKTKMDVMTALHNYRGLVPKLERYVFNDGNDRELLKLDGTIPVRYKGSTYNIPVCIWLLDNHPLSPPMVYVEPTQDMLIKPSRHVDQNGKVFLPYLHEWNLNSSDLVGLIQIMIMVFNEMPPVYSKPKSAQPPPTATQYGTPYPTNPPGYMPMPRVGGNLPYPTSQPPPTSSAYPPYPSTAGAYPPSSTPYPVYPPAHSTPSSYPPSYNAGVTYPPYPITTSNPLTQTSNTEGTTTSNTGTITEEHIRLSLVSAVSDEVRSKLRDHFEDLRAELTSLQDQQGDLNKGRSKLEGLIAKLDHEQSELDKNVRVLREREKEMKDVVARLNSATQPLDVDEAVTTTAPLYKQLLNAYAEDQATQDAIYYLGEALRREVIDLDSYLRHVRSLSRKQFQLRATMIKCRAKGNMAG